MDNNFEECLDLPLDEGIKRYVRVLREAGIETFESCQGGPGHPCPEPFICLSNEPSAGFEAFTAAMRAGLPVRELKLSYDVQMGMLHGPHWQLVFEKPDL